MEDNQLLATPLIRLLHRVGYEVQHVENCAQARSVGGSFNIGVLDVELPDGFGTDLCADLLDLGIISCVVFFTGTMDQNLLRRAGTFGAVVGKSEGPEPLLASIREALANRPRQAAGGEDDTRKPFSPRGSPRT